MPTSKTDPLRICSRCNQERSLDQFPRRPRSWWCGDCLRTYKKEWDRNNRDKLRRYGRESYNRHKNERLREGKKRYRGLQLDVIEAYGARCACCGVTEPKFLTVDHIDGDGAEHRKTRRGASIYRDIRDAGFPLDYRLLCWTCNAVVGVYGECPHKDAMPPVVMGVDTASNRWHGVIKGDQWHRYVGQSGIKEANPDIRRIQLCNRFRSEVALLPNGSHIYIEEPIMGPNGKTNRLLSLSAGALWSVPAIMDYDLFVHWVDISTWKKTVVGSGGADKEQIRAYSLLHGCREFPADEDLYDAWAIATYGERVLS